MPKTPREIVLAAFSYLSELTPPTQKISDVRIEEIEPIEANAFWSVVLSYDASGEFQFDKKREYKVFRIEDITGKVISMKDKER